MRAHIHAAADEQQTRALMDLFPRAQLDIPRLYGGKERVSRGRHKDLDVYQIVNLTYGLDVDVYRHGDVDAVSR